MAKKRGATFKPEYTCGDVMGLYETRKNDGDEGRLRELSSRFRALCRMEHKVEIPEQYRAITKQVRTPFVRDAAHRITSSMISKKPLTHITPLDEAREDYRTAANIAERFDTAMIERLNKEIGRDLDYDLTYAHVRDGESVLKVQHRPDAWANFPERADGEPADAYQERSRDYKRGADLPIAWRNVDRMSVVYEGGEYGDQWVIEYGEYAKPYLRTRYAMSDGEGGRLINPSAVLEGKPAPEGWLTSATGRSVKVEFWTADEWHVIIDGSEAPGFPKANPYRPYLPYFRAPAYDMESLLYSLMFLVPRMDELLTMKMNWSYLGAYPNPVIETVPNAQGLIALEAPIGNTGNQAANAQAALVWKPGKALELGIGQRISFLVPPPVGSDLNEMVQLLKSLIDVAGIPSIMRGMSGSGDSGYLAAQMRAAVEMAYKVSAISLQRQREKALEFTHWLIANRVQQTVYVQGWSAINNKTGRPTRRASRAWLGMAPDSGGKNIADISKLGPVEVRYRPTAQTDLQADAMIATQLVSAGFYSKRQALETRLQEEDPDGILQEVRVEQMIETDPTLKQAVEDAALAKAGLKRQPQANPAAALVNAQGGPLLPPGPGQLTPSAAGSNVSGMPAVQGVTMPIQPGRPAGMYPGRPGGPNMGAGNGGA
jgi:hypothetical protein